MAVEHDTLITYRQLAKRWDERARRSASQRGRERCGQLADAYRSLIASLAAGAAHPPGDDARR